MKDYYNSFVDLSLQQCLKTDYVDKQKVKKHNAACYKLKKLKDEMEQHPDIAVHGGVKLAREYVDHLKTEIARLESENALKAEYLKKMKEKK